MNDYNIKFNEVLEEVYETARGSKTEDYGETWTRLGLLGIYVKLFIKEGRLNNLIWKNHGKKEPNNESIRDTLIDMAAYAVYGIICLDEDNIDGDKAKKINELEMYTELYKRLEGDNNNANNDD